MCISRLRQVPNSCKGYSLDISYEDCRYWMINWSGSHSWHKRLVTRFVSLSSCHRFPYMRRCALPVSVSIFSSWLQYWGCLSLGLYITSFTATSKTGGQLELRECVVVVGFQSSHISRLPLTPIIGESNLSWLRPNSTTFQRLPDNTIQAHREEALKNIRLQRLYLQSV